MKITPEDIRAIRDLAVSPADNEEWTIQLALRLVDIYDRGFNDGMRAEWKRQADADMNGIITGEAGQRLHCPHHDMVIPLDECDASHPTEDDAYMGGVCPYTMAHTREWCGYRDCRKS